MPAEERAAPPSSGSAVRRRILLGAFGDPGHAFPMIALGRALAARGHDVWLQTWERWRTHVEAERITFVPAPEYGAFPGRPGELGFYEAAYHATRDTLPLVRDLAPDAVVSDILTLAPALAGELHGAPVATLIPHIYPAGDRGLPIYSIGARLPRTALGRAFWEASNLPVRRGLEQGRRELNAIRNQLGLPPLPHAHGGISTELALVATFPQLEYPRRWPAHVHVIGPLMWEPPAPPVALPAGEGPLVLIAPSTSQDPGHTLVRAALRGLARAPVRVLATLNKRPPTAPRWQSTPATAPTAPLAPEAATGAAEGLPTPANATVVDWLSYAATMPHCDVVVGHAGHGTLARAFACGRPMVACPVAGDMNENAARIAWSGTGIRIPRRFVAPRPLRLAVEQALRDSAMRRHAEDLAAWAARNDAATAATQLIERMLDRRAKLRGWESNPQPLG